MTPVRQGHTSGIGFFVITEGEASVSIDGKEVARVGPGDHFGELGLIGERRLRTATVTAETPLRCAELASWHFRQFVKESPVARCEGARRKAERVRLPWLRAGSRRPRR